MVVKLVLVSLWLSSVLFGISSRTVWLVERFQQLYLLMEKKKKSNFMISPERVKTLWNNCKHRRGQEINSEALYISMYTWLLKLFFTNKSAEIFRICISRSCLLLVLLWLWIYQKNLESGKSTSERNSKQRDAKNWELHLCRHFCWYLYVNQSWCKSNTCSWCKLTLLQSTVEQKSLC